MGKILIPGSSGGGVSSDDVTASKAQVLQGYKTVTNDSDDEVIEGTMPDRGVGDTSARMDTQDVTNSRVSVDIPEGYYHGNNGHPWVWIGWKNIADILGIDKNKIVSSATYAGVTGAVIDKGNGTPENNTSDEMFYYEPFSGYVVRFEPGAYYMLAQWKPVVKVPVSLVKSAVNYHPEKTLNDTITCNERGTVSVIDTKVNDYSINASKGWGIDTRRGKFWATLGHGNAYYCREDNSPHVDVPATEFGTAGADSVLQWQTASSQHGIKFQGTIPRWIATHGDVILANPSHSGQGFAYDLPGVGRCIVVGIKNGAFIQGANYVALPSQNFQPWNIRKNVNINGMIGTMEDYGAGGVPFNGATFDGRLASGVANKGFILRDIERYLNLKNNSYGYKGIVDGGLKLTNGYSYNTSFKSAPYVGFVLSKSINLTPFRQLKVGFRFLRFSGDGTQSQPAKISLEFGVTPISQAGGESYSNESYTILKNIGQYFNEISYEMTSTRVGAGNQSDQSQQYLTLDVSLKQGHHFIYFMLGKIIHEYSNGSVYAEVIINHIELIN